MDKETDLTVSERNVQQLWAVVVAQLVERSPPTPEIHGTNPVIGKLLSVLFYLFNVNCVEKTKIYKKRQGMAHLKNKCANKIKNIQPNSQPISANNPPSIGTKYAHLNRLVLVSVTRFGRNFATLAKF